VTWSYCYLYVMLDIFSRYVVGWMIAPAESAVLAQRLISELEGPDSMLSPEQWLHNRVAKRGLIICDKDNGLHVGYSYNYLDLLNWCPGGYGCLDSQRTGSANVPWAGLSSKTNGKSETSSGHHTLSL